MLLGLTPYTILPLRHGIPKTLAEKYRVGKAFHIYRPLLTDALGQQSWASLNMSTGQLTITADPIWLAAATYPVIVDPTFGYTTAGGTALAGYSVFSAAVANMVNQRTAVTGDTVTSFSVSSKRDTQNASGTISFSAYSVVASNPSARLASPVSIAISGESQAWFTTAAVSQTLVNGTVYCVGISSETDADPVSIYYDDGSAPGRINSTNTTLADPFGATGTDSGRHYSWYATYTAGGGAVRRIFVVS
jgi:hypothetical protein